jgi:hypothetical protein
MLQGLERNFEMQAGMGLSSEDEGDKLKRIFLEGNPILLVSQGQGQGCRLLAGLAALQSSLHVACCGIAWIVIHIPYSKLQSQVMPGLQSRSRQLHVLCSLCGPQAITTVVSLLHTVFDMLAFKNDIGFWKNNKVPDTWYLGERGGGDGAETRYRSRELH